MSRSPQEFKGSKAYRDGWRAINLLIRSDGSWSGRERNLCYRNLGDGGFENQAFVSGLDLPADGRAFVAIDLDSDGDLDFVLKNRSAPQLRVFRNQTEAPRSVTLRLRGPAGNEEAVGARVWLKTSARELMREVASGAGFLSQAPRVAHFGLLADEEPRELRVRWPGGEVSRHTALPTSVGDWVVAKKGGSVERYARGAVAVGAGEPTAAPPEDGTWLAEPVPAPVFSLDGPSGPVELTETPGQPVLLNFWATWCPPCRKELEEFAAAEDSLSKAGLRVIAVSVDDDETRAAVPGFLREVGGTFETAYADDALVGAYSVLNRQLFDRRRDLAIPTSFLIDGEGLVRKIYRGKAPVEQIVADAREGQGDPLPFAGKWIRSGPHRDFAALGAALAERDLAEAAIRMFARAEEIGETAPALTNNLAGALVRAGDVDQAKAMLRASLAENPNQPDIAVNLAGLLLEEGESDEALSLLHPALAAQPDDAAGWNLLGSAYLMLALNDGAEDAFRRAAQLDDTSVAAVENLAMVLAAKGQAQEAITLFERARSLGADSAKLHTNLGILYAQTGSPARARGSLERAVAAGPDDYAARVNLAVFHAQAGRWQLARESAVVAQEIDPSRIDAFLMEVEMLQADGQLTEARRKLAALLEMWPNDRRARQLAEKLP